MHPRPVTKDPSTEETVTRAVAYFATLTPAKRAAALAYLQRRILPGTELHPRR